MHILSDVMAPISLAELATRHSDDPVAVFTVTDRVTVGWLDAVAPGGVAHVLNIRLDDDTVLKVTEDQEFVLLDGTIIKAHDLKPGHSLCPLYLSLDKHGYPNYRETSSYNAGALTHIDHQKVRKVSRMVAEYKEGGRLIPSTFVTHVDQNRKNCHPINLTVTHKNNTKQRKVVAPIVAALKEAQKVIQAHPKNHKIIQVTIGKPEAVYSCVMPHSDNLAIGGVFLRSTKGE